MMWVILYGYLPVSLVTFILYGFDKHRAAAGKWRVPERRLHWLELLGGWPGALLGQAVFRHKRRKLKYMAVFVAIVALHIAGWAVWYWRFGSG